MQETEIDNRKYSIPDCHDGDREWLVSMLYAVKTRKFEPGPHITEVQRFAMIREYEDIFNKKLSENKAHTGPQAARRASNCKLRERVECYKMLRDGVTFGPDII